MITTLKDYFSSIAKKSHTLLLQLHKFISSRCGKNVKMMTQARAA